MGVVSQKFDSVSAHAQSVIQENDRARKGFLDLVIFVNRTAHVQIQIQIGSGYRGVAMLDYDLNFYSKAC